MATIITLTQKKASSSKAQPLEIEPITIEAPADTADARWKRMEDSADTGGLTVGKGQLHLHRTILTKFLPIIAIVWDLEAWHISVKENKA